jgi:hypothetical protein
VCGGLSILVRGCLIKKRPKAGGKAPLNRSGPQEGLYPKLVINALRAKGLPSSPKSLRLVGFTPPRGLRLGWGSRGLGAAVPR